MKSLEARQAERAERRAAERGETSTEASPEAKAKAGKAAKVKGNDPHAGNGGGAETPAPTPLPEWGNPS